MTSSSPMGTKCCELCACKNRSLKMQELTKCFNHSFQEAFDGACDNPNCPCHKTPPVSEPSLQGKIALFLRNTIPEYDFGEQVYDAEGAAKAILALVDGEKGISEPDHIPPNCGCECHEKFTYKSHGNCCFILKPIPTPTPPPTEGIDTLVRDVCSVVPKSKSEVRRRLEALIAQAISDERARVVEYFDEWIKVAPPTDAELLTALRDASFIKAL